ncbi:MAG: ABC transporter permease, partial [Acidimicrobiia bacterium]
LDDPVAVQYGRWVSNAAQGDLGTSLFSSREVSDAIRERFPVTFGLALVSVVIALAVCIPAGIVAAVARDSWVDRLATVVASAGIAMPNFWLGFLLILVFSIQLEWVPAVGYVPFTDDPVGWAQRIALPALTLATAAIAEGTRQLRASLIGVLERDYIRTARAKGLRRYRVLGKHALKNAVGPMATVMSARFAFMFGGSVVVEQIFGIPGFGQLAVQAVQNRDIPMIQGVVLVSGVIVLVMNVAVDMLQGYFNPRVRTV